jgi:hypothetical protein
LVELADCPVTLQAAIFGVVKYRLVGHHSVLKVVLDLVQSAERHRRDGTVTLRGLLDEAGVGELADLAKACAKRRDWVSGVGDKQNGERGVDRPLLREWQVIPPERGRVNLFDIPTGTVGFDPEKLKNTVSILVVGGGERKAYNRAV